MESAEDLEAKLALYRSQLDQVNQLLALESDNEQFLKLKDDLERVISLTEALHAQLVGANLQGNADFSFPPLAGNTVGGRSGEEKSSLESAPDRAHVSDKGSSAAAETEGGEDDEDEEENDEQDDEGSEGYAERGLRVGDRVLVSGGEYPFAGVITAMISSAEFKVRYYAYDAEVSLPLTSLQRIPRGEFKSSDVSVGLKCQCKYSVDQQFYDVVVSKKTAIGFLVTYTEYGNSEEVPIEFLRPAPLDLQKELQGGASVASHTAGKEPEKGKDKEEGKLIPIPEKLKILPTDTEDEKARKMKKLKIIKNHNRKVEQELETAQVVQSWQKFAAKKVRFFFVFAMLVTSGRREG